MKPHGPVNALFMQSHYGPSGYVKPMGRMSPIVECIKFYTQHKPGCSGAEIACGCGLSQLKTKALAEYKKLERGCGK
jgi:hypothetical protein